MERQGSGTLGFINIGRLLGSDHHSVTFRDYRSTPHTPWVVGCENVLLKLDQQLIDVGRGGASFYFLLEQCAII